MELLIQNCSIIDGTGAPAFRGSVGFSSGKLLVFRGGQTPPAECVIDARGLTLVPGFLDAHSHGDLTMKSPFATLSKLSQGFTTQIAGQCGASMFPVDGVHAGIFPKFASGIAPHPDLPDSLEQLSSAKSYFEWLNTLQPPISTKSFVGLGTLRIWAMGYAARRPDDTELARMKRMLRRCIREGALGLSSGLVYAPCSYADNEEILALLRVVHEEGGIYATHPRNEADSAVESRRESIRLAMQADVPLCVSHLKAAGRDNWGKPRRILADIDRAVESGLAALIDCYPYTAGSTALNVSIPPRYFSNGPSGLVEALLNTREREVIREEMVRKSDYENYVYNCGGFSGVFVSSCPVDHCAEGMFVSEYAEMTGQDPFDAYCDILIRNGGLGLGVYFHMNEDDVAEILAHPLCVLGTDGLIGTRTENPHPRAFGSTARFYDLLVRKRGLLTPEQAVRKMSGQTAEFFRFRNKGRISNGCDADAVLLDLQAFQDTATYRRGASFCRGVRAVFSGGRRVDLTALESKSMIE
jgi:N-acyl-D-amino-acid deacylase